LASWFGDEIVTGFRNTGYKYIYYIKEVEIIHAYRIIKRQQNKRLGHCEILPETQHISRYIKG
jgi:hypothetical protein